MEESFEITQFRETTIEEELKKLHLNKELEQMLLSKVEDIHKRYAKRINEYGKCLEESEELIVSYRQVLKNIIATSHYEK